MRHEDEDARSAPEKFRATSGRMTGVLGLVLVGVLAVREVLDPGSDFDFWLPAGCALMAVLIWAFLLRPDARVERGELVLRGPLDTRWVPVAAIEHVAVGAVLAVTAGGRRYTNAGIGRSFRQVRRDAGRDLTELSYGGFVETRIQALAEAARRDREPAGAVRRRWAWPEIAALLVTAVAFVVSLLV